MNDRFQPFISVIIPTYKDNDVLRKCLIALNGQTYPKDFYNVIIVNNDSESSIAIPEGGSLQIQVLGEDKPGSYAARNKGLNNTHADIIAFTDADCVPDKNWLINAVNTFKKFPETKRLSGSIRVFREENSSWLVSRFESITAFNQKYNAKKGVGVTANLFVGRSVFDVVGKFNDSLMSGGDIEWNQRATNMGIPLLFCEKVQVAHPARKNIKSLVRKFRRVGGGGFTRAKDATTVFRFILWHFIPPIRYGNVLIQDGKKTHEVIFACLIFWILKLSMVIEIIRLALGGKPLR